MLKKQQPAKYQLKISEADIERTCTDWLALDGWRGLKTDPVSRREWGKGFGEKGMADYVYIRYVSYYESRWVGRAQVMWVEYKSKKGKAAEHQKRWISDERARGALVVLLGEDCAKSIEGFQDWYRHRSGLQRRAC